MKGTDTMGKHKRIISLVVAAAIAASSWGLTSSSPASGTTGKVTICHAAGRAGTTKFVTLTISHNAAYGQAGHFNEDGTPQAGHEDDYIGVCRGTVVTVVTTPTTQPPTTVTTEPDDGTTTTTEPPTITTLPPEIDEPCVQVPGGSACARRSTPKFAG